MTSLLAQTLELPCGAALSNRLVKSAMSECLADPDNHSTPRLETHYRRWAGSGAGLLLIGNIQVDRWHLENPGNIVIDDTFDLANLCLRWPDPCWLFPRALLLSSVSSSSVGQTTTHYSDFFKKSE